MDTDELYYVDGQYQHHTEMAVLIDIGGDNVWLPLSQVKLEDEPDELSRGDPISVGIPQWLAEDKGIV